MAKAFQNSSEPSSRDHEIAALVRSVADGDEHAMAQLYDMTSGLIYGLVLRIVDDEGVAEEVLLDVYMQAWRQAASYDEKRGAPLAWLTTIARSRAIDRFRSAKQEWQRKRPLDTVALQSTEANGEEGAYITELQTIVRTALDALSPEQREAIELAYYGGLSHSEIAGRLGQPLGTMKTRIRLGMMKMREILKPEYARGL